MKRCSKCGVEKAHADFPARKTSRDGLHGWCKPCYRAYYAAAQGRWRQANPDQARENQQRWRRENHEAALAREARYRDERRDILRERERQRRATHPDKIRQNYRKWRETHREQELNRLAARRGLTLPTPDVEAQIVDLLQQPCTYCGTTDNMTIDHIVPLSRGGKHEPANLAPACLSCNSSKGAKLLDEWDYGVPDVP